MSIRVRLASIVLQVSIFLLLVVPLSAQTTYYFKGTPDDQANKLGESINVVRYGVASPQTMQK